MTSDSRKRAMVAQIQAIDPVCGMTVDPDRAAARHDHNGQTYYFCSVNCQQRFQADPGRFLRADHIPAMTETAAPTPGSARQYVCPMHPQVVRDRPGPCP